MPDLEDDAVRLLQDMQRASALVDEADGPAEYQVRLVALAMIARQLLRADLALLPEQLRCMTGERDDERVIAQGWEQRATEAEAKVARLTEQASRLVETWRARACAERG